MNGKENPYPKFGCRLYRPVPRRVLAFERMAGKIDPAEAREPAPTEIADHAIGLAREDPRFGGVAPRIAEIFHWPPWADPCRDERRVILPWVAICKKQAEAELRLHYLHHHVLAIRRERWRRAHPRPKDRGWTGQPLKDAASALPKRKRSFRLPKYDGFPDAVSPPPPSLPAVPLNRPGSREKEILLCYDLLFGNRIVEGADGNALISQSAFAA